MYTSLDVDADCLHLSSPLSISFTFYNWKNSSIKSSSLRFSIFMETLCYSFALCCVYERCGFKNICMVVGWRMRLRDSDVYRRCKFLSFVCTVQKGSGSSKTACASILPFKIAVATKAENDISSFQPPTNLFSTPLAR